MFHPLVDHSLVFPSSLFLLSVVALAPSPSAIPLVLLLSGLQLYARTTLHTRNHLSSATMAWLACTAGTTLAHIGPSLDALSTPITSVVILFFLSSVSTATSIAVVYLDLHYAHPRSLWSTLTFFPVLWASIWEIVSLMSPVGRLVTWSPVTGTSSYTWVSKFVGPVGIDFIVGAWSVILVEVASRSTFLPEPADLISFGTTEQSTQPVTPPQSNKHVLALGTVLVALIAPSYATQFLPSPLFTAETTPLMVACALPTTHLPDGRYSAPTLDDYIAESLKLSGAGARIVIWPEGAVRFETPADRDAGFEKLINESFANRNGYYLGVGFEEFDSSQTGSRTSMKRNGFALLNKKDGVLLEYYKRHLVPIAESFSISPSSTPPSIYTIPLKHPKDTHAPDWAPAPYTRPVPVTASICLDFASPSSFTSLESRPSLILAPARTWHKSVGLAMFNQAKQRAYETGATILWCDGGEGGLSGVIGNGYSEPLQVGAGSWTKTIGIPYPFNEQKLGFAWIGNFGALFVLWLLCGGGFVAAEVLENAQKRDMGSLLAYRNKLNVVDGARRIFAALRERRRVAAVNAEIERGEQDRLISFD